MNPDLLKTSQKSFQVQRINCNYQPEQNPVRYFNNFQHNQMHTHHPGPMRKEKNVISLIKLKLQNSQQHATAKQSKNTTHVTLSKLCAQLKACYLMCTWGADVWMLYHGSRCAAFIIFCLQEETKMGLYILIIIVLNTSRKDSLSTSQS